MSSSEPAEAVRAPLSRDRVVEAGVAFADEHGVDPLSMRKLGQRLGVEAMSLYNHVANKTDLLDGMVDAVFAEIGTPTPGDDWRASMRDRAVRARTVLHHHPWAVGLLDSRTVPGPATLRHHEAMLATLRGAGFDLDLTARAFWLLDSYLYGFVLQELSLPFDTSTDAQTFAQTIIAEQVAATYPHLAEIAAFYGSGAGFDLDEAFVDGLDLVVDGLEAERVERARP
jgi:AcrR family transcriptional regulator